MNLSQLLTPQRPQPAGAQPQPPRVERVRHGVKVRTLRVDAVERLTPAMVRVTFSGDELGDFVSLGFDDHVKLLTPTAAGETARRDYTPRHHDAQAGVLVIDFAVHDAGPATLWALAAKPGDRLQVAGPKGSAIVSPDVRRWLLVGDETALPAIGRRIEEAGSDVSITSVVAVADAQEAQTFQTRAALTALWAHRPLSAAADASALIAALESVRIEPRTFAWIAAEAAVAKAVRAYLATERGQPLNWMKAAGYWVMGRVDAHERIG